MGKKKKVDINGAPLQSVTIGEIKKSKYGWIGTILLFCLFVGVVYFLPELSKFYQSYIEGGTVPSNNRPSGNTTFNNTTNDNTTKEEPKEDSTIYEFGKDISVKVGNLDISNISLTENELSFKVANKSDDNIDLEELNIYVEMYNDNTKDKQITNTIAITGLLSSGDSKVYSYSIASSAKFFSIKEILEEDYTYIIIEPNEDGVALLTCENDTEKFTYSFIDDKLTDINHVSTLMKDDEDYDNKYAIFYGYISKYSSVAGATPRIRSYEDYIVFTFHIDYNYFGLTLEEDYYFAKNSSPRIVNFKMESKLFNCK